MCRMVKSRIFHLQGTLDYQQIAQYNKKNNRTYRLCKGIVSNMTIKQIKIIFSNFLKFLFLVISIVVLIQRAPWISNKLWHNINILKNHINIILNIYTIMEGQFSADTLLYFTHILLLSNYRQWIRHTL